MDNSDITANKMVLRTATRNLQEAIQFANKASNAGYLGDSITRLVNAIQQTINVANNILDDL